MNKYRNKKTAIDGITFDSIKESKKYLELKMLQRCKCIVNFECQVKFPIMFDGKLICNYICDFVVYNLDGTRQIIDVKGVKTSIYNLKKKMMRIINGLEIEEC